jgi:hypothetical protein
MTAPCGDTESPLRRAFPASAEPDLVTRRSGSEAASHFAPFGL